MTILTGTWSKSHSQAASATTRAVAITCRSRNTSSRPNRSGRSFDTASPRRCDPSCQISIHPARTDRRSTIAPPTDWRHVLATRDGQQVSVHAPTHPFTGLPRGLRQHDTNHARRDLAANVVPEPTTRERRRPPAVRHRLTHLHLGHPLAGGAPLFARHPHVTATHIRQ